jgi:hypothetical protein
VSSVPVSPSPSVIDASTPPTTPTTLDPEAQEIADRAAVEAAYARFWVAVGEIIRTPNSQRDALMSSVAIDPIRSKILEEARDSEAKGLDRYGAVVAHPYWEQSIEGAATAVMGDCQDSSQFGVINIATGEKTNAGVPDNKIRAVLVRSDDSIWRVQDIFFLVDEKC